MGSGEEQPLFSEAELSFFYCSCIEKKTQLTARSCSEATVLLYFKKYALKWVKYSSLEINLFKIMFNFTNVSPDLQSLPPSLGLFNILPYFGRPGICLLFSSFCSHGALI